MASAGFHVLDSSDIGFLPSACAHFRIGLGACDACQKACPTGAIEVSGAGVRLAGHCIGCGRCVGACPTGALKIRNLDDEWPLPNGDAAVVIECARVLIAQRPALARVVPCLGSLSPGRLLGLVVGNPQGAVELVNHGWCASCPAGRGLDGALTGRLARLRELLLAAGWSRARLPVQRRRPLPLTLRQDGVSGATDTPRIDRRRFFGRLAGQAAQTIVPSPPPKTPAPSAVRREDGVFPERVRWTHAVARLAQATGRPPPARAFPALRVAGECLGHGVCAAVCPTAALRRYRSETHIGLEFTAAWCTGCGLCARHCPERVLELDDAGAAAGDPLTPVTVSLHPQGTCPECGAATAVTGLCLSCRRTKSLTRQMFGCAASGGHSGIP